MTKTAKIILGLAIVAIVSILAVVLIKSKSNNSSGVGIPSGPEIENYVPAIMYSGGYYSAKGIYTTSTFQADGATTLNGTLAVTGTTTITKSPDGFVAYLGFTVATGTAKAVFTNPSSDMVCDGRSGYFQGVGTTFAPSLVVAFGTSTSATGYSTNLLASTTLATTTNQFFAETYTSPFRLLSGESIVGALSDITNTAASSTYYSNWSMQYGVHCWTMGS